MVGGRVLALLAHKSSVINTFPNRLPANVFCLAKRYGEPQGTKAVAGRQPQDPPLVIHCVISRTP